MEWISVKEQLPPLPPKTCNGARYLCAYTLFTDHVFVGELMYSYYGTWVLGEHELNNAVTHWMELPEPPPQ